MEKYIELVRSETAKVLSMDEASIFTDSALVNGLDADSLDIIDLTYSLAQKLKITMPTASLYQLAEEILTEDELAQLFNDSVLTTLGKELFSSSCYKYTEKQLESIKNLADIFSETSIFNWASLCKIVSESKEKNADDLLKNDILSFFQKRK